MEKPTKRKGIRKLDGYVDRVWLSYGQTIQVARYEPVNIHAGFATDVRSGEKPSEAFKRAEKVVVKRMKQEIKSLEKQKRKKRG